MRNQRWLEAYWHFWIKTANLGDYLFIAHVVRLKKLACLARLKSKSLSLSDGLKIEYCVGNFELIEVFFPFMGGE